MQELDASLTEDGGGTQLTWKQGEARLGHFAVAGAFDSATVDLEMSPDGGTTWIGVNSDLTGISEAAYATFNLPYGVLVRANVSSSGASTDLTTWWAVSNH